MAALLAPLAPLAAQRATAPAPAVSAPITNVRYAVTFNRTTAASRSLRVSMTFNVTGNAPVLLSWPTWTPGAYEVSDFIRYATNFTVGGEGGTPRWDKLDPDTWRIVPNGARAITVSFSYLATALDNAMAWSTTDFAFFNGTNVLPYPEGRSMDFPATVTVHTEEQWRVATGMTPGTAPRTWTARNYHELVDMPFFIGQLEVDSARIGDTMFHTATYPAGVLRGAERERFWDQVRRMVPPMVRVFGEMPVATYTNLIMFDSSLTGASALEHANSHVGVYSPFIVGHEFFPSITAHEIFHVWNVKRLRPADMVPYRYDRSQPTTWLWVSEGVTDYYADLAQVRGGILDSAEFIGLLSEKMSEVRAAPNVALEDASLSTWVRPTDGTHTIYYPKGALAGFMLDVMIRDASDNARSLDTVLRELYQTTFKAGRGFTSQDWWSAVTRAAGGRSFTDVNARYIDGREPMPWATLLPMAGLRLHVDSLFEPWLGLATTFDSLGVLVTDVEPDGAARAAGVELGDYLVRLADMPVTDADFGARYRARYARRAGETVPLVVRRGGEERTLTLPVRTRLRTVETVQFDRNASPKALRIRAGILRGDG